MIQLNSSLEITIGTSPQSGLTVKRDIELVKAGLLYGDHVRLCSPNTSIFSIFDIIGSAKGSNRLKLMEQLVPAFQPEPSEQAKALLGIEGLKKLRQQKHLSGKAIAAKMIAERKIEAAWKEMRSQINLMLMGAGVHELLPAAESGRLSLIPLDLSKGTESLINDYVDKVAAAVLDHRTYPLFDEHTAKIIEAGIREGKLSAPSGSVARGKQVALAADLFSKLPTFPEATMSEILDIRSALEKPLARFRAGLIEASEKLASASWGSSFEADAEQFFRKTVAPSVDEINELVRSNSIWRSVTRTLADESVIKGITGSALSVALASMVGIEAWISGAVGGGVVAAKAVEEIIKKRKEPEKNWLYFYYRLHTEL